MKVNISFGEDEENITQMEETIRKMALRATGFDTGSASGSDSESDSDDSVPDSEKKMKAKKLVHVLLRKISRRLYAITSGHTMSSSVQVWLWIRMRGRKHV